MDRVLVVEDDDAVRDLMVDSLHEGGFYVDAVAHDQAAYERIVSIPTLDAVVLDVNLGRGTTGYDVARFARQVIPHVAVIYVSGEVASASFRAFGVPGSQFVQKPFSAAQLLEAVSKGAAAH